MEEYDLGLEEAITVYRKLTDQYNGERWILEHRAELAYIIFTSLTFGYLIEGGLLEVSEEFKLLVWYHIRKEKERKDNQSISAQRRRHDKRIQFSLTRDEWNNAKEFFDYSCAYCGERVGLTYEHYVPLSRGGTFTADNIIPVCKSCNSSKCDRLFEEWNSNRGICDKRRESRIEDYFSDILNGE